MFTDIVGYSSFMAEDEQHALQILANNRENHRRCLASYNGHLVKEIGDGVLCWFTSALDAVHCAIDIQSSVVNQPYQLRIGIHLGEVLLQGEDVFGNSVNIASRVQTLANPGAVFVTAQVVESTQGISNISTRLLGEQKLKNIEQPVRVFGLRHEHLTEPEIPFPMEASDPLGRQILHYRVEEQIGSGGMGYVYRAFDTRLERPVALKFLPPYLSRDEASKSRFLREAQMAAAIQHPNICNIYDIEEAEDGKLFIVMEHLEGKTLDKLIKEKPLSVEDTLAYGRQIAEGLMAAHERNIIHRDIKPSNIIVDDKGHVKILDFGLAEIATAHRSKEGSILGTAAYMSPEQARGEVLDRRTDIWSVGAVLYELLSGQRAFPGEYEYMIVHAILNDDPKPVAVLAPSAPPALALLLHECLEKERAYRVQTMADLHSSLRRLQRNLEKGLPMTLVTAAPARFATRQSWLPYAFGATFLLLAGFAWQLAGSDSSREPMPRAAARLSAFTANGGLALSPDWSPDGQWIIYASDEQGSMDLWKKPLEGGRAVRLTQGAGHESHPDWSPDGRLIAFSSHGEQPGLYIISADGGNPTAIAEFGANPSWAPDSRRLIFDWKGDLFLIPEAGQEPQRIVSGTASSPHAVWTPDGEHLLYWNRTQGDLHRIELASQSIQPMGLIPAGEEVSGLAISRDGRKLVFSKGPFGGNKDLWIINLDPDTYQPKGKAFPLNVTTTDDIDCALSPDGQHIAFTARGLERHLWQYELNKQGLPTGNPRQVTFGGQLNYYPVLSADGSTLVWTSHSNGKGVLYHRRLDSGAEINKVTNEWGGEVREIVPAIGSSGTPIYYASTLGGSYQLWRAPDVGSVALRLTSVEQPIRDVSPSLGPDNRTLAFYSNRSGSWDIWRFTDENGRKPQQLTNWPGNEMYPSWSPDGQNITFISNKGGQNDIWIMAADGSRPMVLLEDPAQEGWPMWSPNGRWFFFVSDRNDACNLWAKPTSGGEVFPITNFEQLSVGLPESILNTKFAVADDKLILPLEERKGEVYLLEIEE